MKKIKDITHCSESPKFSDLKKMRVVRDQALWQLHQFEGLTRSRIHELNQEDVNFKYRKIRVRPRAKPKKRWMKVSHYTIKTLKNWIMLDGKRPLDHPIFISLDPRSFGNRLYHGTITRIIKNIRSIDSLLERI